MQIGIKRVDESFSNDATSQKIRVLVVDDDVTILKTARAMLMGSGFDCVTLGTAKEAITLLQETEENRQFDLILLDITMPVHDGFSVLQAIRSIKQYDRISIVMLTADGRQEMVRRSFNLGACDYILKPFSREMLVQRVRGNLNLHVNLKDVRDMLEQLVFEDPTLSASPGLKKINTKAYKLYSTVLKERRICISLPIQVYPKVLAAGTDIEVLDQVTVYLRLVQKWIKIAIDHEKAAEIEPIRPSTGFETCLSDDASEMRFRREFLQANVPAQKSSDHQVVNFASHTEDFECSQRLELLPAMGCSSKLLKKLLKAVFDREEALREAGALPEVFAAEKPEGQSP